jgi:hypothetical protein
MDSGTSAMILSKESPGVVAISTIPGKDVGKVSLILKNTFIKKGIDAVCFVDTEY